MALIYAYQSRGIVKDITIRDANENAISVGPNDKIRVVIGHEGRLGVETNDAFADAAFQVISGAQASGGSTLVKGGGSNGAHRLTLKAADLNFKPGTYTLFVDLYDNAASDWKNVDRQVFVLEDT